MTIFLADENFNNDILRGLRIREPRIGLVRVQDVGLKGQPDHEILEWAAGNNRIILTHDVSTFTKYAYERVERGERMPGVFEVNARSPIGIIVEDLRILALCSLTDEWEGQVRYLPFR